MGQKKEIRKSQNKIKRGPAMDDEPYYYQSSTYLYSLKSHPTYNFYVGRSDSVQALWLDDWDIFLLLFNSDGDLEESKEFLHKDFSLTWNDKISEIHIKELSNNIKSKYNLKNAPIKIKRFWLPKIRVGIEDISDLMKEFVLNPSEFSNIDKEVILV